jgi:predicted aconitase with swiveling domain
MPAKLRAKNNQEIITNMILVVDSYAAADVDQYLLGKSIDLAGYVFKNGYTGDVSNAKMYVSENLTGEAVLAMSAAPADADTVTIGGVVFTFRTTLGSTAGSVLISGSADAAGANLAALINTPGTTTTYGVALSAADQVTLTSTLKIAATASASGDTVTIVGTGSGRLTLAEAITDTNDVWSKNIIHAYFGKKGAIDLVVQDIKEVDMRETADRRGTNVFSSYLAGIKTFADGAKKFLDVHINA